MHKTSQRGFTLIEIAIVLVIIGLLLGGVLKGQELITSARVRNLIAQQDGIKAAFFGFQDRYRAFPGDYSAATKNMKCPTTCIDGDGNGLIKSITGGATVNEQTLVWTHLASAGFLNGSYSMSAGGDDPTDENTPRNPYNTFLQFIHDDVYQDAVTPAEKLNLKTGSQIPVEIMAEVDRKIDDGNAQRGQFRFSTYDGETGSAPGGAGAAGACTDNTGGWLVANGVANCGGAGLF